MNMADNDKQDSNIQEEKLDDQTGKRILELQKSVGNKKVGEIFNLSKEEGSKDRVEIEEDSADLLNRRRERFKGAAFSGKRGIRPSTVTPFRGVKSSFEGEKGKIVDKVFAGRGKTKELGALVKRYDSLEPLDFTLKYKLLGEIKHQCMSYLKRREVVDRDEGLNSLYRQVSKEELIVGHLKLYQEAQGAEDRLKQLNEAKSCLELETDSAELEEAFNYLKDYIEQELKRWAK